MNEVVIRAEGLGKKYLIGHQAERDPNPTLRDFLARAAKGFARSAGDMLRGRQLVSGDELEEFWALKDVNFEIRRGDVVGIIGRNGAGKSTLLKILSRITEPSEGRIAIKGRVASLLEVGAGFHPELTGRENIFLNGAILGMSRAEIRSKFDAIVDFAGVERFIDTPVKRYSSGMYVRLAFGVAAHLEPEILVVDEVLAVGDVEFQKKCLGKMKDVASQGRTVLFVSHNMSALSSLCTRGLLLSEGHVANDDEVSAVINKYFNKTTVALSTSLKDHANRQRGMTPALTNVAIDTLNEARPETGEPLRVAITVDTTSLEHFVLSQPQVLLGFSDSHGHRIFTAFSSYQSDEPARIDRGEYLYECRIEALPLVPGRYTLTVRLWGPDQLIDSIDAALAFDVTWTNRPARLLRWNSTLGPIYVPANWSWTATQTSRELTNL